MNKGIIITSSPPKPFKLKESKPSVSDNILEILRLYKDMSPSVQSVVLEHMNAAHFDGILESVE